MAPQRDEIFKQKVNDYVQHIILQKFTNFHAIRSWRFQNVCNEIGWPSFMRHPVYVSMHSMASVRIGLQCSVASAAAFVLQKH